MSSSKLSWVSRVFPLVLALGAGSLSACNENPVPVLESIEPAKAAAGSGALTLTVKGSEFRLFSVVRFAGTDLATTFISETELTAAVPADLLREAGEKPVTVFNKPPKGGESAAKTFTVTGSVPVNRAPVANAGPDVAATLGVKVTLDGSGSSDLDGDALTFRWTLFMPSGSTAVLADSATPRPSFTPDVAGDYTATLIVNDGKVDSAPDTVVVGTSTNHLPPVADAGPDQTALVGALVALDGSGSSSPEGNALTYAWSFVSRPQGSAATLDDPAAVKPSFTVDRPGSYELQLVVSDQVGSSEPSTVTITTRNSAPVADPGAAQTAKVGAQVQLDGSRSTDADGDPLTFSWSFTSRPQGSAATLSDATAAKPGFTVDVAGIYVVQLVVHDGALGSAPATVTITTENSAPIANAGPNQTVTVLTDVQLDGSGSTDVDGDALTYSWSLITRPTGSAAALSEATAVKPSFTVDRPGTFVAQLVVSDGTFTSPPSTVTVTTRNSPPGAEAGSAQTVAVGATVTLDGSGSSDVDGDALAFTWSFTSRPAGSAAVLSNPTAVKPSFVADVRGTYVVQLVVHDGTVAGAPDTVTISTSNSTPIANAGPAQTVQVGATVSLDGSGSTDPDGDLLTYSWSLLSKPVGSAAALSGFSLLVTTFVVDKPGTYVAQLIVSDGVAQSAPSTVTIATTNSPPTANAGPDQAVAVGSVVALSGTGSSDPDGDALTFAWSLTSTPTGSVAALSSTTAVSPTFTADRPGTYLAQLIVNDGTASSAPDTVTVTTLNQAPVANAGSSQTVSVGAPTTLDGTGSTDADGDTLTYSWTVGSSPSGSTATLTGADTATPTLTPDLAGAYVLTLTVSDGSLTSSASVTLTASQPWLTLRLVDTARVGVGRQASVEVKLSAPAGLNGVPVTLVSEATGLLTVDAPATVTLAAGATTGLVTVTGVAAGTARLRATAPGFVDGVLDAIVTLNLITIPTTLVVPLGQTTALPVTLAPGVAPAGGVPVALSTSDAAKVDFVASTVTVPQGALSANGTVRGLSIGTVTVVASNPNYASAIGQVTTAANLDIVPTGLTLYAGFNPYPVTIQLQAAGKAVAAPAPGIAVTVSAADPGCVQAVSPTTITTGLVSTTTTLVYGGTATLPCTTTVTASAPGNPGLVSDSFAVTVRPQPTITLSGLSPIGLGLQDCCFSGYLGGATHGGVTVRLESLDPSRLRVSPNSTTAGTASVDYPLLDGQTSFSFALHAVEGTSVPATVGLKVSAPGFLDASATVSVVQPAFDLYSVPGSTTSLSPNALFYVRTGVASGTNFSGVQAIRVGGQPVTFTVTSSAPATAQLATTAVTGPTATVQVLPGQSYSPGSLAAGGIYLDPVGPGTATIAATGPGFFATGGASRTVTVSAPVITMSSLGTLGAGLQDCCYSAYLGASAHGGVTLRLQSSDPAKVLIAPSSTAAGVATLDVPLADGQTTASFALQALEYGQLPTTATITASAPGFSSVTNTVAIVQPAIDLYSVPGSLTSLDAPRLFYVRTGIPASNNATLNAVQPVRQGGVAVVSTVTSSTVTAATVANSGGASGSATTTIVPGQSYSPSSLAAGGVTVNAVGAGTTTLSATAPGFVATGRATASVTVTAPAITFGGLPASVGAGLQTGAFGVYLGTSGHGGVILHLASSDPSRVLLASSSTSPGQPSLDIAMAAGVSSTSFYLQGADAATPLPGAVTLTATAPGFTSATGTATVVAPALDLYALPATTTTLSSDTLFYVRTGIPVANNANLSEVQAVRFGGVARVATVTNLASTVARLTTTGVSDQTVTVTLAPGQSYSPSSIAAGGVAFDPLTAGTTTVGATIPGFVSTARATVGVTVTTPAITLGLPTTVGAGLSNCCFSGGLGGSAHGGVTVRLTSSDPGKVLLAPNSTSPGAPFLDLPVANGGTSFSFAVQGVEGATSLPAAVTVTATAQGFTDGTGVVTVVQPAVELYGVPASLSAGSGDRVFYVRTGVPSAGSASLADIQPVRVGGTAVTATVGVTPASVAQVVTQSGVGSTATLTLPPGTSMTASSVAQGGVSLRPVATGTATLNVSIPGFVSTGTATKSATITP